MRCPTCGKRVEGVAPGGACPHCGSALRGRGVAERRSSAAKAAASRASVEGLSGLGRRRRDAGQLAKAGVRFVVGIALVVLFCGLVYLVLFSTEIVGGRTVPDVVGWRAERAAAELEDDDFTVATTKQASSERAQGMVVATSPEAGERIERGSTVILTVSSGNEAGDAAPDAGE